MAGQWIPMRVDLHEDPAVIRIGLLLAIEPACVVGHLHRLWGWFSEQSSDGHACVTHERDNVCAVLDTLVGRVGFTDAMVTVGWLDVDLDACCVKIPKWEHWLSQSGKQRLLAARRKRRSRSPDVTQMSRSQRDKVVTTEQNRTEHHPPLPPRGSVGVVDRLQKGFGFGRAEAERLADSNGWSDLDLDAWRDLDLDGRARSPAAYRKSLMRFYRRPEEAGTAKPEADEPGYSRPFVPPPQEPADPPPENLAEEYRKRKGGPRES